MSPHAAMARTLTKSANDMKSRSLAALGMTKSSMNCCGDDDREGDRHAAHQDAERGVLVLDQLFPERAWREAIEQHERADEEDDAEDGEDDSREHVSRQVPERIRCHITFLAGIGRSRGRGTRVDTIQGCRARCAGRSSLRSGG